MTATTEETLYRDHPSMFRNDPVWFTLSVLLVAAFGVGLLILIPWYLKCLGTTLTITNHRTTLRRGLLSRSITEVWHENVRNVQVHQTFLQRIFGVGRIGVSSAGQSGLEIDVRGIPNPDKVKRIIDDHRRAA